MLTEADRTAIAAEVNAHFKMLSALLPMPHCEITKATRVFGVSVLRRWGYEGLMEARRLLAAGTVFEPPS